MSTDACCRKRCTEAGALAFAISTASCALVLLFDLLVLRLIGVVVLHLTCMQGLIDGCKQIKELALQLSSKKK